MIGVNHSLIRKMKYHMHEDGAVSYIIGVNGLCWIKSQEP
jgi:exosome complex RNA-binding protein Rrp4